jgi:hypothetical protein
MSLPFVEDEEGEMTEEEGSRVVLNGTKRHYSRLRCLGRLSGQSLGGFLAGDI